MRRILVAAGRRVRRALVPAVVPTLMLVFGLLGATRAAHAGPIPSDIFLQFSFEGPGPVTGCAFADPAGGFCIESSGTLTALLDAPAWTFVAAPGGATLTVVDTFLSGDSFQVFDFGILIGPTSAPAPDVDCGDDPVICLGTAGMSVGTFALAAGAHSLTLVAAAGSELGSAYLQVTGAQATVAEPTSLALTLAAMVVAWRSRAIRVTRTSRKARP